ncbi:lytic murein transglycosylase [Lichenibacterium dinghuense]|uniref:lytic murein transglycosylase n=1 Tax=Lichenibacterium dinghuense TaxID=2895977 RepID=UPI001F35312F|nr:lytic murein transglycosylase [Lichenibacterium sp. 6Y81]
MQWPPMMARALSGPALTLLLALPAAAEPAPQPPSPAALAAFVASLRPAAAARGVTPATFDAAFAGVAPDPAVAALTRRQAELNKPTGAYLAAAVTPARVAEGRALLAKYSDDLAAIERRFGVPGPILVAIWGLETNYGAAPGAKDVIRSMATLGAMGYRADLYRDELLAALDILQRGEAPRDALRGSWAGAMGQPQFMPSSFLKYAVDWHGDGRRDIWGDAPDALASIADFLHEQGWTPGQPWGFEVRLPDDFDLGAASRAPFPAWAARGVVRADGDALPGDGTGILYFPAGSPGPAFLVTTNFSVIKTYNSSDSYVLAVGTLADRMAGGPPVAAAWPTAAPIGRDDRIALQARLAALGLPVDDRTGRISLTLRDAIREAQKRVGLVPDGNPTAALVRALERGG